MCSNSVPSAAGSGAAYSTNSKPSVPIGLTSSISAMSGSLMLATLTSRIDPSPELVSNVTIMADVAQALELEKFLPYRLSILAQIVSESLHDLYAGPFGLTVTQWRVMAAVGLMKRGLVERATDRNDRRRASLRLSARGRTMHARIVPLALDYEGRLYKALSAGDRRRFDALADRLFAHA